MSVGPKILIVEARFYDDIADALVKGAIAELETAGAGFKRIIVPGIFEIPAVIRFYIRSMELRAAEEHFAGYITLGCAIRGETDHYDHICRETMRGIQDLVLHHSLALGNGVLTVHNKAQAMARLPNNKRNFGAQAARAVLRMIEIKRELHLIAGN